MPCLTAAERTAIEAEITEIDEMIVLVKVAYKSSLTNSEIQAYRFDSGDSSQRSDRRKPAEIKKEWDDLKAERNRLQRRLAGTLNVVMKFRRRRGCNVRY